MNVYVASSWRNQFQPQVVSALRAAGHEVYDFKSPRPGDNGFHWSEIDPNWKRWTPDDLVAALQHPIAQAGFESDMAALRACDACVLVLPCGRSAHLELGWAVGAGKQAIVLSVEERDTRGHSMSDAPCSACGDLDGCHLPAKPSMEPELMYLMCDRVVTSIRGVVDALAHAPQHTPAA